MIEQGLYKFLKANEALQDLLPSNNSIFLISAGESAKYPHITFSVVSSVNDTTMDGPSGYVIRRYQFTTSARDTGDPNSGAVVAKTVADVLRQQMDGLTGTLPDGTIVYNVILDNEIDTHDDETDVYSVLQDYFIHFRRATPSTVFTTS